MGGVLQTHLHFFFLPEEQRKQFTRACVPADLDVAEVFQAIRPSLRKRGGNCRGICFSASYVLTALNEVYRCPD